MRKNFTHNYRFVCTLVSIALSMLSVHTSFASTTNLSFNTSRSVDKVHLTHHMASKPLLSQMTMAHNGSCEHCKKSSFCGKCVNSCSVASALAAVMPDCQTAYQIDRVVQHLSKHKLAFINYSLFRPPRH